MDLSRLITYLLCHCIKVGRFFGIPVRIHWSFWALPLAIGLLTLPQGGVGTAALVVGLILVFYGQAVVLHEYGHALTARYFGVRTRDIILTPIGGIARMEDMPEEPIHEILIALAGPAVNVVFVAGMSFALLLGGYDPIAVLRAAYESRSLGEAVDFLAFLMLGNIVMACFNMLPAFPSDGGRVLRSLLSLFLSRLTATRVAVYLGACVAVGMAVYGIKDEKPQLPFIAALFIFIGQMELMMLRRQAEMRRRPRVRWVWAAPEWPGALAPPEPDFSGYAWDDGRAAWVEWRGGVAVRTCGMRLG